MPLRVGGFGRVGLGSRASNGVGVRRFMAPGFLAPRIEGL